MVFKSRRRILPHAFFLALCFGIGAAGTAMEFKPFYTGFRLEANRNSYEYAAAGAAAEALFSLSPEIKIGGGILFSSDFRAFNSLELYAEAGCLFPFTFLYGRARLMAGVAVGYEQIWHEGSAVHTASVGAEARTFFRAARTGTSKFVLVPTVRAGYPYLFSAGCSFGVLF